MATVHQSQISSWMRCPTAFMYERQGRPRRQLSATAWGSVIHHALETFERVRHTEGLTHADAVDAAVSTFEYYWHPLNIAAICEPVDEWLPRQDYSTLRRNGIDRIREYCTLMQLDESTLLATEYSFQVPIPNTWDEDLGEPHILAGTIDRLALRRYRSRPYLSVEDYKTGKDYQFLRHNLQFSAYCMATTQKEFWTGWRGEDGFGPDKGADMHTRFTKYARRGMWINMRQNKQQDAGWRGPRDYQRFALAVEQITASMRADIYPLSLSGATCQYCEFAAICGGTGLPDPKHGSPGNLT